MQKNPCPLARAVPVTIASLVFNGAGDHVSCQGGQDCVWGSDLAVVTIESWAYFASTIGHHAIMNDDIWEPGNIHYQIHDSAYGFDVNGNGDRTFDWQPTPGALSPRCLCRSELKDLPLPARTDTLRSAAAAAVQGSGTC